MPVGLWPVPPDCVLALPDLSKRKPERTFTITAGGRMFTITAASVVDVKRLTRIGHTEDLTAAQVFASTGTTADAYLADIDKAVELPLTA